MLNRKYEINTQKILITLDKYKNVSRYWCPTLLFSFTQDRKQQTSSSWSTGTFMLPMLAGAVSV